MIPFPAPMGWRPTALHVPDVVTFVGGCPVDPAHPAEWTEHREDTRLRASHYCPVCEVARPGSPHLSAELEGRRARMRAAVGPESGHVAPLADSGAECAAQGGAA